MQCLVRHRLIQMILTDLKFVAFVFALFCKFVLFNETVLLRERGKRQIEKISLAVTWRCMAVRHPQEVVYTEARCMLASQVRSFALNSRGD